MTKQPDSAPYLGTYRRPPSGQNVVRLEGAQLMVDNQPIAFYATDLAAVTSGNNKGNPVEFIRDKSGAVRWVRVVGRVARRD